MRLEPANGQVKPICITPDNVEIQWEVVALVRRVS